MGGDFSFQGNLKTTDHICFNYGRSMQGNIYLTSVLWTKKGWMYVIEFSMHKKCDIWSHNSGWRGAGFVVQLCTAETQKKKNKNVTMSLASTSLSQFLRINASLIFKLQYNRECRRGKEVKNICLFSFFN